MAQPAGWIGIDVAKAWLDVARSDGPGVTRFANDAAGVSALAASWPVPPALVVVEATGGYERLVVATLQAAGLAVAVVNPRQVRDFARASGRLATSDTLDAQVLAHFAERMRPEVRPAATAASQDLAALLARRRQLLEMQTAERHRRATVAARLRPGLEAHLAWLAEQRAELDRLLEETVREDPTTQAKAAVLRSIPGVGPVVSSTLLGLLPELGALTRHEVAALAGVAPLNQDSGTRTGPRRIWGGRAPVRTALYMAVVSGLRHNPVIRTHYDQLRARGKPVKVALVAGRRKLLTIANALLRDGVPWAGSDDASSLPAQGPGPLAA